jgi:hypothetical protein
MSERGDMATGPDSATSEVESDTDDIKLVTPVRLDEPPGPPEQQGVVGGIFPNGPLRGLVGVFPEAAPVLEMGFDVRQTVFGTRDFARPALPFMWGCCNFETIADRDELSPTIELGCITTIDGDWSRSGAVGMTQIIANDIVRAYDVPHIRTAVFIIRMMPNREESPFSNVCIVADRYWDRVMYAERRTIDPQDMRAISFQTIREVCGWDTCVEQATDCILRAWNGGGEHVIELMMTLLAARLAIIGSTYRACYERIVGREWAADPPRVLRLVVIEHAPDLRVNVWSRMRAL